MVRMEEIQAAMKSRSARLKMCADKTEGTEWMERTEGGLREQVLRWFVETQASLILCNGNFPTWFHGFVPRQEAEDHLRDKSFGSFLIRLSEKASGYILSYKGQDRCRHFVINQTKEGMLVVSGDSITHNSLPELLEYFKTTPIQPFGECLISEKEVEPPSDDLYDVVHCKPSVKSGVSVQALRSLWDHRCEVTPKGPPALPPKSSTRKLISSTSIDRNNIVQMRNLPLRNALSGGHISHGMEQHSQSDQKWPSSTGTEGLHQRQRMHAWESEGFSSLDSHLQCYSEYDDHVSTSDVHHNSRSRSLPHLDEDHHHGSHTAHSLLAASPHLPFVLPKSGPVSSLSQLKEQNLPDLPDTNLMTLQPNPLYQASSGLSSGPTSHWDPHCNPQPSRLSEISSKTISEPLTPENAYQDTLEHQNTYEDLPTIQQTNLATQENTYEDLPEIQQGNLSTQENNTYEDLPEIQQGNLSTQENNTYEDLPEIQQGNLQTQENNTYEDIPATHNNTYATIKELQPKQQSSLGKKTHKWWKFKPDNKKK
ncbi:uncharacterized protein si:ch211-112g6.4 [Pygocentrus nattereri]|uniref:SH2 domain containing 7 n=1 Tax=Pygocentrus nattereri TaxID=42514 RepID=A0A3B4E1K2_PYGNA|nr:uncharacterized protein si:ch211-112g6.4 [Pygocentrus nattereri]